MSWTSRRTPPPRSPAEHASPLPSWKPRQTSPRRSGPNALTPQVEDCCEASLIARPSCLASIPMGQRSCQGVCSKMLGGRGRSDRDGNRPMGRGRVDECLRDSPTPRALAPSHHAQRWQCGSGTPHGGVWRCVQVDSAGRAGPHAYCPVTVSCWWWTPRGWPPRPLASRRPRSLRRRFGSPPTGR